MKIQNYHFDIELVMTRYERLEGWIETLTISQIKDLLLETLDYCIDSEYVNFWDSSEAPTWDGNGERLDGKEDENELD